MALDTQKTKAARQVWHIEKVGEPTSGRIERTVISSNWNSSAETNPMKETLTPKGKNKKNHLQPSVDLKLKAK